MKRYLIIFISIFYFFAASSQSSYHWQWAKQNQLFNSYFGISGNITNNNGDVFLNGYFYDSIQIANHKIMDTTSPLHYTCFFLVKIDTLGNVVWEKHKRSQGWYSIFTDKKQNLSSINSGLKSFTKYNFSGSLKDSIPVLINVYTSTGSSGYLQPTSIVYDFLDNFYLSGYFTCDSVQFGSNMLRASNGSNFLVKYDSTGNIRWVKQTPNYRIDKLTADNKGNIYAACVNDYDTVQTNPLVVASGFGNDMLVMKIDSGGVIRWATPCGSSAFFDEWKGLTCVHDKIYFAGEFGGNYIKLGNDSLYSPAYAPFFVGRIDTAGHVLWGKGAIGTGTPYDAASGVAADTLGRVYLTGSYESNFLQFDANHSIYNTGNGNLFIAAYDSSGQIAWIKGSDASNKNDGANSISCSMDGRSVYVVGGFSSGAETFGHTTLPLLGGNNYYIAKLSPDSCVVTPPMVNYSRLSFCQGDSIHLSATGNHAIWSNGVAGNTLVVKDSLKAWVTVTQANGCTVSSPYVQAAVHPMPDTTLLANPSTHDLCKGSTLVLSVAVPGNTFQWNNGAQTQAITIDTTGNYSVILSSPYGCVDTSHSYSVIQRPIPAAPDSIALHGGRLYAYPSGAYIYNWYRNNTLFDITSTNQLGSWILIDGQSFTVTIVSPYGCESAQCPVYVYHDSSIGIASIANEGGMELYPNPASVSTVISLQYAVNHAAIQLINLLGETVLTKTNQSGNQFTLDLSAQSQGIYFVEVEQSGVVWRGKVVKE